MAADNSAKNDPPITTTGHAKTLHNVPVVSPTDNSPREEAQQQAPRKKRFSFGGGNDGRGSPMFASLESVRGKHLMTGYDDQKPPEGFIGAAFRRFVTAKSGPAVVDGK